MEGLPDNQPKKKDSQSNRFSKALKILTLSAGLALGKGEAIAQNQNPVQSEKTKTERVDSSEAQEKRLVTSIKSLAENLLKEKKLERQDARDPLYFGNIGKYEIQFYDRDEDGKFAESASSERVTISYIDPTTNVRYTINQGAIGILGAARSKVDLPDFKPMTAEQYAAEYGTVLISLDLKDTVYIKKLSTPEMQKMVDDVRVTEINESLQK